MKRTLNIFMGLVLAAGMISCEKTTEGVTGITYYPVIELNGGTEVIYVGETYEDPGYTAVMNGEDITDQVTVADNIDNTTVGTYSVVYSAVNEQGFSASASRTVYVVAEAGVENLYVGRMTTPKGAVLSGGTHLVTDNGDGTYTLDDVMGGYYCWYTYPGYDAMGYDFFAEVDFTLDADGVMTQVGEVGGWYFAADVKLFIIDGQYDAATGVITFNTSYNGSTLNVVLTPISK